MSYEAQLQFKENKVKNNLVRIGGFDQIFIESVMESVVGMEQPWHYRNKAQFPVGTDKDGRIITGFYAGRTHSIIANTDCALGVEENEPILQKVLAYMQNESISAYDETTGQGLVRHILIRKGFTSGEIMVCLVINGKNLPKEDRLVSTLREIPGMTSIWLNYNTKNTNVIMGTEGRVLWGQNTITDVIHRRSIEEINSGKDCLRYDSKENAPQGITFAISPLSFYQVNPVQTQKLYARALDFAGLQGHETVWDLYCGIGTISLFLAKAVPQGKVVGVEIVPEAVENARENAKLNGFENVSFRCGAAEDVAPGLLEKYGADVVVVDPPRKGCDGSLLETMVSMAPEKIVYVSCDPATLARDVKRLGEMFQPGPEAYAQDLVPQAYAQHRSAGGQAVQKAEGCLVAFVLHRSGPGGQDEFFCRLNRLFQFRRKVGDHARNGHSRHSDEFREIPGKGIPVVDDPDVRLTHGAHMIE